MAARLRVSRFVSVKSYLKAGKNPYTWWFETGFYGPGCEVRDCWFRATLYERAFRVSVPFCRPSLVLQARES